MSNEETKQQDETRVGAQLNYTVTPHKSHKAWKKIAIGGTSGILMGAGGMVAALAYAASAEDNEVDDQSISNDDLDIPVMVINADDADDLFVNRNQVADNGDNDLDVEMAYVDDELSFSDAFAEARGQVGPGGVFEWRGGVFNTYYVEEWDALSGEERDIFAQKVSVTIGADEMDDEEMYAHWDDGAEALNLDDDDIGDDVVSVEGEDVQILGIDEYDGHAVAMLDVDGDDEADFAVIDMDDNYELSSDDAVVYPNGEISSVDELIAKADDLDEDDSVYSNDGDDDGFDNDYFAENPDVADDMPDYVDDGLIDS